MQRHSYNPFRSAVCAVLVFAACCTALAQSTQATGIGGLPSVASLWTLTAGAIVAAIISFARASRENKAWSWRVMIQETAGGTMAGLVLTLIVSEFHHLGFNGAVALSGLGGAFGWATFNAIAAIASGKTGVKFEAIGPAPSPQPPAPKGDSNEGNGHAG